MPPCMTCLKYIKHFANIKWFWMWIKTHLLCHLCVIASQFRYITFPGCLILTSFILLIQTTVPWMEGRTVGPPVKLLTSASLYKLEAQCSLWYIGFNWLPCISLNINYAWHMLWLYQSKAWQYTYSTLSHGPESPIPSAKAADTTFIGGTYQPMK
jgi:hypothetical protein